MYCHVKSLIIFGFLFWLILCCTDLLGDSYWKQHSNHLETVLETSSSIGSSSSDNLKEKVADKTNKITIGFLVWNIAAFICATFFYSIVRYLSSLLLFAVKVYRKPSWILSLLKSKDIIKTAISDINVSNLVNQSVTYISSKLLTKPKSPKNTCQVIFTNQSFTNEEVKTEQKSQLNNLLINLHEMRLENRDLSLKLVMLEKQNLEYQRNMDEFNLLKEKLQKTSSLLRSTTQNLDELNEIKSNLEFEIYNLQKERKELEAKIMDLMEENKKLKGNLGIGEKESDIFKSKCCSKKKSTLQSCSKVSLDLDETYEKNDDMEASKANILIDYFSPKLIFENNPLSNSTLTTLSESSLASSEENGSPSKNISSTTAFQNLIKKISLSTHSHRIF